MDKNKLDLNWIMSFYENNGRDLNETVKQYVNKFSPYFYDYKVFRRRVRDNIDRFYANGGKIDSNYAIEENIFYGLDVEEQYEFANLSAYKVDGTIMTVEEYCEFYNIPYKDVKSWKLVTHTNRAFYNIQSHQINQKGRSFEEITEMIVEKIRQLPDLPHTIDRTNIGNHLLVIDPADIHVGKYASKYEVGEKDAYDMTVAVKRVYEGVDQMLNASKGYAINKILFVMGNDVLHTDNTRRTTTNNTPQDTHGMFYENFATAKEMYIQIIKKLVEVADVHVQFNPSNHDYQSGWMLSEVINAYFHECKNVTFDTDMSHRKYYKYGKNLIGTTHGDCGKEANLPLAMAHEAKDWWAETEHKYIYTHHIHSKRSQDYMGVNVESMRSVSGADSWHHKSMFQHAPKTIECFIHHEDYGQVARFTHKFF